ncbi:MAG TPA: Stf0 family sulfotransferase [Kiloniellales bacterium]|nr:Stf0 family sulfotransferase [Kiloniellales bacterium]
MTAYDSYVICTAPRSGSTLLCKLLAATGVSGNPDSHFHRQSLEHWLADLGVTPQPALSELELVQLAFRAAIVEGTRGGMFGLRLQRHSFGFFIEKLALLHPGYANDVERFQAAFGRTLFIHLSRQDKVEEAVSLVKAEQTGLWHRAPDGTELERLSPPKEPVYDAAAIRVHLEEVTAYERDWRQWFASSGIDPLRLTYEELAADPVETLRVVLDRLGVGRQAADGVQPGVAKLADDTNRDWVARFRAEQLNPA